jgi:uncharacterized glyoxalase superfamily protein PhnB
MATNRSAPPGPVVPMLIYRNVSEAADWLCAAFGFAEPLRMERDGRIASAHLNAGVGGSIMLGSARSGQSPEWADQAELAPPRAGEVPAVMVVPVEDVDAHYGRAKTQGARILNPPTDYPFGERQYTAEDLEGFRWTFTQSIADVDPAQWAIVR